MKTRMYLAYAVFNLDDGHDFMTIGVYRKLECAVNAMKRYMVDNENPELVKELDSVPEGETYDEDCNRYYSIEQIDVHG